MSFLQILNENGEVNEALLKTVNLTNEDFLKLYKYMLITRVLDGWLLKLQRMGKVAIHAPNEGEEAVAVGTAYAAKPEDWFFPTYRELGLLVTRGMSIREILCRWLANKEDILKGHEFAIYGSKALHIVPTTTPIAVHLPSAVGFAHAAKLRRDKIVVLAYLSDGATSKGDFHEACNWAGVFKVPIVFICRNNQYAISLHVSRQTASETLAIKAVAYGIKSMRVDGNDIIAVYKSAKEAIEMARNYEPVFIEYLTYRLGSHTTADDPKRYRSNEEVEFWRQKDPIKRFRNFLISSGIITEQEDQNLRKEIELMIEDEVKKALEIPPPPIEVIFEDVYSEIPWNLKEEMEEIIEDFRGG
jgi:pyruvate dehydrogenase E1 component alpha subunit